MEAVTTAANAGHPGQGPPHALEAPDVAGAGGVVDDADDEEEGGLEQGVGHQQGHPGGGGLRVAHAEEHHQQAQLRHGAVGQEQLGVVLAEGAHARRRAW